MPPKHVLASAIAPCAPAVLLNIAGVTSSSIFTANYLMTGFALVFSYAGFLILGLPVLMLLTRLGILNLAAVLFCGAVLGVLVFLLFLLTLGAVLESSSPFHPLAYVWGAALGFAVALCYGLLARLPWRSKASEA